MNYELVKQLKDAGFPQNESNPQVHTDICGNFDNTDPDCKSENRGVSPTLEELLEACGHAIILRDFLNIELPDEQRLGAPNEWVWGAQINFETIVKRISGWGVTPREAVARLWLALNKK